MPLWPIFMRNRSSSCLRPPGTKYWKCARLALVSETPDNQTVAIRDRDPIRQSGGGQSAGFYRRKNEKLYPGIALG